MTDTTVWELGKTTNQPLEVVIFQAVAYKAWNPGGRIDGEWAAALTGVLAGSQPWRRAVAHLANDPVDDAGDVAHLALDGTEADPAATFAALVLVQLGQRIPVTNHAVAERLVVAGLGDIDTDGFCGYPEDAPTWSQLAHGAINVDDLEPG